MGFEIKESKVEDGVLSLSVVVAKDDVDEAFRSVRRELSRYVRIPGFRKGKAPLSVIASHVGRERFAHEVERELLPRYYYEAIEACGQRPLSPVNYEDKTLEKGKPFEFVAKVTVAPEIELGDYKEAAVTVPEVDEVTDEQVEERVQHLLVRAATTKDKDGAAEMGDLVTVSTEGKVGDKSFKSFSRKAMSVRLGDDEVFPGFDEQVVGMSKGDQKTFSLDAPEDTDNQVLKDAKVDFDVTVRRVRAVELPELDEAFLSQLSGNVESADDLRGRLRRELENEARKKASEAYDEALQEMLLGCVTVTPPEALVDVRVTERLAEFKEQFKGDYRFSDYLNEWDRTEDDVKAELREAATKQLCIEFALDEIAVREEISATDEEVGERLKAIARLMRRSPHDVVEMVDSSGSRVLKKQELTREKAFAWLREARS